MIVTVLEDRDFILGFILLTEDATAASEAGRQPQKMLLLPFQGLNKAEFYQLDRKAFFSIRLSLPWDVK